MMKRVNKILFFPLEKIKFKLKNKSETIYKIPSVIAHCMGGTIIIDKLFEEFTPEEKKSIIFHEKYHKHTLRYILFSIKSIFIKKYNSKQLEEFAADKYAAIENGKENMINALKKIRVLAMGGKIKYNNNHPTIKERIKAVENIP